MKKILCMMLAVCTVLSFAVLPASAKVTDTFLSYDNSSASSFGNGSNVTTEPNNPQNNVLEFTAAGAQDWLDGQQIGINSIEMDFYRKDSEAGAIAFRVNTSVNTSSWESLFTIKIGESDKEFLGNLRGKLIFRFLKANSAWVTNGTLIDAEQWYSIKIIIDKPGDKIHYLLGKKGETLELIGTSVFSSSNLNQNEATLNMLNVSTADGGKTLFDNIKAVQYANIHEAMTSLSSAADAEKEFKEYASLNLIDTSAYDALTFKYGFFDAFVSKTYNTDADFTTAYNERIEEYEAFDDLIIYNMTKSDGKITKLKIGFNKDFPKADSPKLIVAAYKNSELVYIKDYTTEALEENTVREYSDLDITESQIDKIKVFAWWNLKDCYPIAHATEKQITNN